MTKGLFRLVGAILCIAAAPMLSGGGTGATGHSGPVRIAVFVPGVAAGSPLYEKMVSGAQKAASEYPGLTVKVLEGGFNQADWPEKMTSLAATGEYAYILSSNASMPSIAAEVAKSFPAQKFIIMDGYLKGNPQIYSLMYNQVEQGYLAGYIAGLVTKSGMKGATRDLKVGAIVAQEYPVLTQQILPGFQQGLKAVDPGITLDIRFIGNWYDAKKGADLANNMMDAGVDVILPIAGGAGQGVIKAAQDRGRYVVAFDSNVYALAPGTIVGCATLDQERAVYESVRKAMEGTLPFGTADVVDAKGRYVDFADLDPLYAKSVPADISAKMADILKKFRSGALALAVPKM
jgi:basic membrane lipoprotein Med (substrate-binding protein (PBP1-ABC) superfamily)